MQKLLQQDLTTEIYLELSNSHQQLVCESGVSCSADIFVVCQIKIEKKRSNESTNE
jgi:hypothetical protein